MFVFAASLVFALPQPPLPLEPCRQISSRFPPLDLGIKCFGHFALQFDGADGIGEGGPLALALIDTAAAKQGKAGQGTAGRARRGLVVGTSPSLSGAEGRGSGVQHSALHPGHGAGERGWPQNGALTVPAHLCCCGLHLQHCLTFGQVLTSLPCPQITSHQETALLFCSAALPRRCCFPSTQVETSCMR